LFYKIEYGIAPEYLASLYKTLRTLPTRHSNDLIYQQELHFNSFFPTAIHEWNNLPLNIGSLPKKIYCSKVIYKVTRNILKITSYNMVIGNLNYYTQVYAQNAAP
jgi:hypothetical protein